MAEQHPHEGAENAQAGPAPGFPQGASHPERLTRLETVMEHQDKRLTGMEEAFKRHQEDMDAGFNKVHEKLERMDTQQSHRDRKLIFYLGLFIGGAFVLGFLWTVFVDGSIALGNLGITGG